MSEFLRHFPDIHWTLIGLFIFIILFGLFVISTFLPSQMKIHQRLQRLPLEDEQGSAL